MKGEILDSATSKASIRKIQILSALTVLLWSVSACAFNGGFGGGLMPTPSPKFMSNNIDDGEVFKKSSVMNSFRVERINILNNPKDYLIPLREGNLDHDFVLTKETRGDDVSVFRYSQLYKKLPVFGADLTVRLSVKEGTVILTGYFFSSIKTPVKPVHNVPALVQKAQKIMDGGTYDGKHELGILPGDKVFYLCQKLRINRGPLENYVVYIDAISGDMLKIYNAVNSSR